MRLDQLKNHSVFVDSCCFIYLFEESNAYADVLEKLFSPDFSESIIVSSVISVSEVITKPIREKRDDVAEKYLRLFEQLPIKIEVVDKSVAIRGATIRAKSGFGLLDSYQIAMAESGECDYFLTNDKQLKKYKNMGVVLIADLVE